MPRLFVAVWPPGDVVEAVRALPRPSVGGVRWTGPEHWHVTLRFLGSVDDVAAVDAAVAGAVAGLPVVEAVAGPAVGRFGNRVLHVPVEGLAEVAAAVVGATRELGKPPEDRPFAGHLTLARVGRDARVRLGRLAGAPISGRWLVSDVTLVESHLSPKGAAYEVVGTFPLGG